MPLYPRCAAWAGTLPSGCSPPGFRARALGHGLVNLKEGRA